ncbi:Na(+)/Ca(2+) exchanging [Sulfolobus sp. A20]|nr:sodium:calcium antiporter [Sulfolobus sp. A20]TRM75362.1 sodium:calcium antiporter [Sulfolobus sp. E5]TRM76076.1 sodium:calcium antiporter [Sulfolobus sp. A20-N-F8]TRM79427.1 sodium:calcium antiporter [Sulfolobus sp. B5]TRM81253.1 sodium:calcium antiporter [Sulfolobus sp. D5]TRM83249.1 sodium:calcium antiporter [Sulfolobus sp. A20-N-F6]TRM88551.1 sodium:calcium antiporter [Sulfolobus sp. C3]TRM89118.1 sodium:calcium antiporter [Sulfolobus sp. E3]TRM94816.1 sodium:calcium antiporter [Sulf
MIFFWLKFIGIFIGIFISAELLAKGADELEDFLGQGISGGIILGILTALPETIFVLIASLKGDFDIAFGSALGGNVLLFTFGIGLVGILYKLRWKSDLSINAEYEVENKFLLLTTLVIAGITIYGTLNIITGVLLFLIYACYVAYRIRKFRGERHEEKNGLGIRKSVMFMIIGGLLLILLSQPFIEYINTISSLFNVPAVWLSLVISPIAGELEEKISAIRLVQMSKTGGSLSILSFVGSKIENSTILLGIVGIFTEYPIYSSLPEILSMIVANVIALYILFDKKLKLSESIALVTIYFAIVFLSFII